jgi:hypothetical protein
VQGSQNAKAIRRETFATLTNRFDLHAYTHTRGRYWRLLVHTSSTSLVLYDSKLLSFLSFSMMPPAKVKLKAVAQAASKACFINVPRLLTPPNYHNWLETLLETPQNRETFITAEKTEIDDLLRLQAGQQFKKDNNLLSKALAQVRCKVPSRVDCTNTCDRPLPRLASMLGLTPKLARFESVNRSELRQLIRGQWPKRRWI